MQLQVPLALAWALTIHKSQGSSLDYMAADVCKCFAEGHVYVAVSRMVSIQSSRYMHTLCSEARMCIHALPYVYVHASPPMGLDP